MLKKILIGSLIIALLGIVALTTYNWLKANGDEQAYKQNRQGWRTINESQNQFVENQNQQNAKRGGSGQGFGRAGANPGGGRYGQSGRGGSERTPVLPERTDDAPLNSTEIEGLLKALDDEYRAWATYTQVIEDFGQVRPFTNIQKSEAQHMAALVSLFERYDLTVPDNPWVGNVDSFGSRQDACMAGVEAEIANAALYDELFATTERGDILTVYQDLQRASTNNHLRAFERCVQ
jgi:hypothetical protein